MNPIHPILSAARRDVSRLEQTYSKRRHELDKSTVGTSHFLYTARRLADTAHRLREARQAERELSIGILG